MIGKDFMKEVLKKAGVTSISNDLAALFREGQSSASVFAPEIYDELYELLVKNSKEVDFHVIMC